MNEKYRKLKFQVEDLLLKVGNLVENSSGGGFEDRLVLRQFERLQEALQDTVYELEHYSKPVKAGTLRRMENGKFELIDGYGKSIAYFSCGNSIECFVEVDEETAWAAGRVEYTSRGGEEGYYFYSREAGHPFLKDGMKARIRTSG